MDPEGRSRTGISAVDSCVLYRLSYLGVVSQMLRVANDQRKMAERDLAAALRPREVACASDAGMSPDDLGAGRAVVVAFRMAFVPIGVFVVIDFVRLAG